MLKKFHRTKKLSTFQTIVIGFAIVILCGAFLLMMPVSSVSREITPFLDALFTSTTSVCVTGLVVRDTGTYWSLFGQSVILLLIQIGGLGVITVAASLAMAAGRKIGLFQKSVTQEAVAAPQVGAVRRLIVVILKCTLAMELIGVIVMAPVFCRDFGILKGIWMSIFHSISAFCNAGMDLMGIRIPYSSLTSYGANIVINLMIMSLIVVGGIGFLTWDDIRAHGIHLKKYRMQSKVILAATGFLIVLPAVFFFFFEFKDMSLGKRLLSSFFQSITSRTAGFNTANLASMSESGQLVMSFLMLIGGAPGSTAGGMKITTFVVLLACAIAVFRRRDSVHLFGRRIDQNTIFTAVTLLLMYTTLGVGGAMVISRMEDLPLLACLYETISAIGTVGLTLGITPQLGSFSKCILMLFMFLGRVGGLTLIYAAQTAYTVQVGRLPQEKITVG